MAFINTTDEAIIFGTPTEPREKTLERKRNWEKRVEAIRPVWQEFLDTMPDDIDGGELWDLWLEQNHVKALSAVHH